MSGNPDQQDIDHNGVVDPDSLLAPATAKNVISVGAAESVRASGGYSSFPWFYFDLSSFCFSTAPIRDDLSSDNPEGMAVPGLIWGASFLFIAEEQKQRRL